MSLGTGGRKNLRAGESVIAAGVTARSCLQMSFLSVSELATFLCGFSGNLSLAVCLGLTVVWRLWFNSLCLFTNFLWALGSPSGGAELTHF